MLVFCCEDANDETGESGRAFNVVLVLFVLFQGLEISRDAAAVVAASSSGQGTPSTRFLDESTVPESIDRVVRSVGPGEADVVVVVVVVVVARDATGMR
jgi:hypothetical protein